MIIDEKGFLGQVGDAYWFTFSQSTGGEATAKVLRVRVQGKVPQAMQKMIKVSFGMGAKSQADYEERLQQAFAIHGERVVHSQTDAGLMCWLDEIRKLAEEDFELLFERL